MKRELVLIFLIVAIIGLIVYGIYELVIGFYQEKNDKDKALNYGMKGFLYLLAGIASIIIIFCEGEITAERVILLFISLIEGISCYKNRKEILQDENSKRNRKIAIYVIWAVLIGAIVMTIPYVVARVTTYLGTDAVWIEFWGGYIGAIIGGIITLIVMKITIKDGKANLAETIEFEKKRMFEERKTQFNDELLMQMVEYQTGILGIIGELQNLKIEENINDRIRVNTILSKLIIVKLESIQDNANYNYVEELLKSVKMVNENLNDFTDKKYKQLKGIEVGDLDLTQKKVNKSINILMSEIETYYIKNK